MLFRSQYTTTHIAGVFYAGSLLSSLANGIIGPLLIVYLLGIGYEPVAIGFLMMLQRVAIMVSEFPTGVLADKYGQRLSVLVSYAGMALVSLVWYLYPSFGVLVVFSVVWGIVYTFQSGAKETLMMRTLGVETDNAARAKMYTRISIWGSVGFMLGGLVAAVVAMIRIQYIWVAAAALYAILWLLYHTCIPRDTISSRSAMSEATGTTPYSGWRLAVRDVIADPGVRRIVIVTIVFTFATAMYGFVYPILFKQSYALPDSMFGILGAVSAGIGILLMMWGGRMATRKNSPFVLLLYGASLVAFLLLLALGGSIGWAMALYIGIELVLQAWYPIFQSYSNAFISSTRRSSVLSLLSVASLVSIALAEWLSGFALLYINTSYILSLSAALVGIAFLGILWSKIKTAS